MKLMEFGSVVSEPAISEDLHRSDLSDLFPTEAARRNSHFQHPSSSSSEHVIIEEDKEESEEQYSEDSPLPTQTNQQQLKKMPTDNRDSGKADKIIIMSKYMTERCMLKYFNYFLGPDPLTQSVA
jgi:CO dehydrogenase/acetyl-CoA synthase beta subunit